ncbi:MAG: AbiH family protein [Candidatus Onthovivens sp.]|nr:AbiH family protein [Candidatus Onthovivens sp.]
MENENKKQLIILGNGFDLACGLKSSYNDFFEQRFEKVKKVNRDRIIKTIPKYKPNNKGSVLNFKVHSLEKPVFNTFKNGYDDKVNYFDLLFLGTRTYMNFDNLSWSNIEQILQETLQIVYKDADGAIFNDKEELNNRAKELEKKCFSNYEFKSNEDKLNLIKFILHIFNKTIGDNNIKKSLEQYETIFGHFITNSINLNTKYLENVQKKLTQLIDQEAKESYVLNFNYSATPLLDPQILNIKRLSNWRNIHGLSRWDSNSRIQVIHKYGNNSIRLPRPIFGISKYDEVKNEFLSKEDPIYQFTKTKRREEKLQQGSRFLDFEFNNNTEKNANFSHFTVPCDTNLVTIFGHSLGMTDYDYFKDIFQKLDLANGNLQLKIYYYQSDLPLLKTSLYNMLEEYSHDVSMNARDLYHKLHNEGRLIFRDSTEIK